MNQLMDKLTVDEMTCYLFGQLTQKEEVDKFFFICLLLNQKSDQPKSRLRSFIRVGEDNFLSEKDKLERSLR